jgi:hypothetical protein
MIHCSAAAAYLLLNPDGAAELAAADVGEHVVDGWAAAATMARR